MTVMDMVKGWNEEKWVGSKFAACMWMYTKAVLFDGRGLPSQDLRQMLLIIVECVSWACEDFLWEHEGDGAQRSLEGERHFGSMEL